MLDSGGWMMDDRRRTAQGIGWKDRGKRIKEKGLRLKDKGWEAGKLGSWETGWPKIKFDTLKLDCNFP